MFNVFSKAVAEQYNKMRNGELYIVEIDTLFDKYLAAFPPGTNPMYKTRTVHDCQCCKQFIRRLGKLVAIIDGKIVTVWDVDVPSPFREVASAMAAYIRNSPIKSVFRTKERKFGNEYNYAEDNTKWEHFHGTVVDRHFAVDPETKRSEIDGIFQVLNRGLTEFRDQDFEAVLDLIDNNALYKGAENKDKILGFRKLMRDFIIAGKTRTFVWANITDRYARFRSEAIGSLFVELAEGKDIDAAVRAFEKKVAPENYQRPTAVITQRMVEDAVQKLTDAGIGGAIYRRYAHMADVSVRDVLYVGNNVKMKDHITALLAPNIKTATPNLKTGVKVTADTFLEAIRGAKSIDLYLENRHSGNFVSLTGSDGPERIFAWDNNFAWSYDGDTTDSVKQRVKAAGGDIDALLRVSLSWFNGDDLDLHCVTPDNNHVYFGNKSNILDVDMNASGPQSRCPVENLAFQRLVDGVYKVYVNQYHRRETIDFGFLIEVEYDGNIHQHSYSKAVQNREDIHCFDLTVSRGKLVKIESPLTGGNVSKEKWGVKTESLVPVAAIMNSPNHWGDNKSGARHLIFALSSCKNPDKARGIYNEYLRGDLKKHSKVFEVLGAKTKCAYTDDQISGIGFSLARGDTVTVVVDGRPFHVTF